MAWTRLIKFESEGAIHYGEPVITDSKDLVSQLESGKLCANVYPGDSFHSLSTSSSERKKVDRILSLLDPRDVPIIKCVGLNYRKHSESFEACDRESTDLE